MRRSQRQIMRLMLELAAGWTKKTQLMHAARLTHSQLQRYLKLLLDRGLLIQSGRYYRTTLKGVGWLDVYATLRQIEESRRT